MKRLLATALILALTTVAACAFADAAADTTASVIRIFESSSQPTQAAAAPKESGVSASEVLRGNGTRAGYLLGHGNIITGSEWVFIGARRARANTDYTIDYSSGNLFFAEPVRTMDSVRVDYRYTATATGERAVTAPGLLGLNIGGNLRTNLTYSYRAADPAKPGVPDVLTYGLNTTTSIGNASTISSMMYMATPQSGNRVSIANSAGVPAAKTAATQAKNAVKKDRMMVQNADLGLGKLRLKLGVQDVGQDFAGFASLRDSKVAAADVLNQLEKEKGLNRTSFAGEMPTGASAGLSFSGGWIKDAKDQISTQAFAFTGSSFRLNYSMRDVGKQFARFKDLKEADAAQMAAEVGIRRTGLGMQFKTGMAAGNPVWSGISQTTLQSQNGELTYRSTELDLGAFEVAADVRTNTGQFTEMRALNDQERSRMALIARRQFNPNSQAAEVVAADKAQFNKEAGLDRKNWNVRYTGGPLKTWLSLTDVDSANGGLSRRDVNIEGKNFSVYLNHHRIDEKFDRLTSLQPVELLHYGNESGMNRTESGGKFALGVGNLAVSHRHVTDGQGAAVTRQGIDFQNPMLTLQANFQNIDPGFARIADLSDTDKKLLLQERGFRRSDFRVKLKATSDLKIESYIYDSSNVTAEQTRAQDRHEIIYKPQKGPQITALTDRFSYVSDTGNLSSYSHERVTFDNKFNVLGGLLFKGLNDTNTTQELTTDAATTHISQMHLETNQSAPVSYTLDTIRTDYGDGKRFEDGYDLGAKNKVSKALALTYGYARTARQENLSETNARVGFDWALRKDLSMSFKLNSRDGGPNGSQYSRQFSMKGMLAKRFLMLSDINVDSGMNTTELKGKQVNCDNGLKLNANLLDGKLAFDNSDKLNAKNGIYYTSRILQYQTNTDPNGPEVTAKKPYRLTFFRQNLITPSGAPARKRNYTLNTRVSGNTGFTLTSYFGKDGQNGAVLPVGGTVLKLTHALTAKTKLIADFTTDLNESTKRRARTIGAGISGDLGSNESYELYYGWSRLMEVEAVDHDAVFRIKYDRKIDDSHKFSLTAQKRSAVDKTSINPYEGETTAKLDFTTVFD